MRQSFIDQMIPFATALGGAIAAFVMALFPVYLMIKNRLEALRIAGEDRSKEIKEVKADVADVKHNTDGLMSRAVAAAKVEGAAIERADATAKADAIVVGVAEALKAEPQDVKIVNPTSEPVPVKTEE